jgi:uncharacterized protein (TIGR02302 family)
MIFLAVSWLGLWTDASPLARKIGVALFGLAFVVSLWPLLRLRLPARHLALDRLDRDSGEKHGPARAFDDTLALGRDDVGSRTLWELHRRRAETAITRLRVAAPRPDMPRRDRFATRAAALLAVVASAVIAGPDLRDRLGAAFEWREGAAAGPSFRVDGWIDPPLYTRLPPLMIDLAAGEQRLRAPVRSTLVIRVAGKADVAVMPGQGLTALPAPENQRADLREQRFTVTGNADLAVRTGLTGGLKLYVEALPDRPPTIALASPPETNARGTFTLTYRAKDDYGIIATEGLVEKGEGFVGRRSLVAAPRIQLTLPADSLGEADTKTTLDLTSHPWAGARVKLTLLARDEAEQEGRSDAVDFVLPQRPFTKPLAKALVEQRRKIVLDPDDRRRVQVALDSLLIAPERYTPQWGVFMGLRSATERLRSAKNDADLLEVADFLWHMAVQLEDGDLSDAERELRAAQDRLRDAIERNAPQEEINRLAQDLRNALDRFLREFAERMQRDGQQADQNSRMPDRMITQDDLNRMLNQMEEAMRRGDMAEAQRLLEQLRNILDNLQTARPNSRMSDPLAREMNRAMDELDQLTRDQQQLRDETFRQGQERRMQQRGERRQQQGQRGQQGQRQQGQRQQGQRGQQGPRQPGEQGGEEQGEGEDGQMDPEGLGRRQQALRDRLQELQRRMRGMGMRGEQGLDDAEGAMGEAQGALGEGQEGSAVDAQGRALEGLQRGMQGMAQQMQQMMGQGDGTEAGDPGPGDPNGRAQNSPRDTDPLGRPNRGPDWSHNGPRIPTADESAVQRARRILEELRRKLGDPTRPREELDYFDRLLRRN